MALPLAVLAAALVPSRPTATSVRAVVSRPGTVYGFGAPGTGFGPKITALQHALPAVVTGIPGRVVQIATSNSDSYALTASGAVWAWGAGSTGELGNGTLVAYRSAPVRVLFPAGVRVRELADPMPYNSALAIDSRGRVWGWGANSDHTVCLPSGYLLAPTLLPLRNVTLATGAGYHSLFDAGSRVYACGDNRYGELGNGTYTGAAVPAAVVGLPDMPVVALESSWRGSGALLADGSYYDWGFNRAGQLGDGTRLNRKRPVRVPLRAPVVAVSQGGSRASNGQTLAVLADGSVWAWGSGTLGQLGTGRLTDAASPVRVAVPAGVRFRSVCSGGDASYALDASGRLWSWGGNGHGQLGTGGYAVRLVPKRTGLRLAQISSTATNVAGLG